MNITLPANATADLMTATSDLIATFSPIATLLIGIILAFFIIDSIINTIKTKQKNDNN